MFEKDLRLVPLFDLYGNLLSDSQKNTFDLYYNDDLSLSEIAENTGITRQGARDSIKRAEEFLRTAEEKLGFYERNRQLLLLITRMESAIEILKSNDFALATSLEQELSRIRALLM